MSMDDILLTCPHCGGSADLHASYDPWEGFYEVYVKCSICGSRGKAYRTGDDPEKSGWSSYDCAQACAAWNLRNGG